MLYYFNLVFIIYFYLINQSRADKVSQFKADVCPPSPFIPNDNKHEVNWFSSLYGKNKQGALANFMSIECPSDHLHTFFELTNIVRRKTAKGSELQIQKFALALTALYHLSDEHRQYLSFAISDRQPLHIFFLPAKEIQSIARHDLVYGDSVAFYDPFLNCLVVPIIQNGLSRMQLDKYYGTIAHELRHRVWHVVNSQFLGRPTAFALPFFPSNKQIQEKVNDEILQGDIRLVTELPILLEKEHRHQLTIGDQQWLSDFRRMSYTRDGRLLTEHNRTVILPQKSYNKLKQGHPILLPLPNSKVSLRLYKDKHFKLLDETQEGPKTILNIRITDALAALILYQNLIDETVDNAYDQLGRVAERDAYLWTSLQIGIIRIVYREIFQSTFDLIQLAINNPRLVNYKKEAPSKETMMTRLDHLDGVRFFSNSTTKIDNDNAPFAFHLTI